MIKKLVFIGGLPRTGTNLISSWCHLHNDVYCFPTALNVGGNGYIQTLINGKLSIDFSGKTDSLFVRRELENFCSEKAKTSAGDIKSKDIIGVRTDLAHRAFKRGNEHHVAPGRQLKLVLTMRKDLYDLYCSHRMMIFKDQLEVFKTSPIEYFREYLQNEFNLMLEIILKYENDVFVFDISDRNRYNELASFLEIEMNDWQKKWIQENVIIYSLKNQNALYESWKKGEKIYIRGKLDSLYNHPLYKRIYEVKNG